MSSHMKIGLDWYIVETLMPDLVGHDRHPTAFLVYFYLFAESRRQNSGEIPISLNEIADAVGVSRRAVQSAIGRLKKRQLLATRAKSATEPTHYRVKTPWSGDGG